MQKRIFQDQLKMYIKTLNCGENASVLQCILVLWHYFTKFNYFKLLIRIT